MPRRPREFEVGGIYHILNRGYEKRKIYLDDNDHLRFIESLYYFNNRDVVKLRDVRKVEKQKYTGPTRVFVPARGQEPVVEVLAFTLMPNHYHLILREIIDGGIALFMQKLGDGYTGYFNEKYDRHGVGGIFQGRYKSVRVQDEMQLGNVFVYVHTNPVELKEPGWKDLKVKNARNAINWLAHYRWSSYHDYVGNPTFPNVTQRDFFLEFYKGEKQCSRAMDDWIKFKAQNAEFDPEVFE